MISVWIKNHEQKLYLWLRGAQTVWTILVVPLALYYFGKLVGSSHAIDAQILTWLYALAVITHLEQYLYPPNHAGAIRVTGMTYANLLFGIFLSSVPSVGRGFYVTFIAAVIFICVVIIVVLALLLVGHRVQWPFMKEKLDKWWHSVLLVVALGFFGSPFFVGLWTFGYPLWLELRFGAAANVLVLTITAQVLSLIVPTVRAITAKNNAYFEEQKKLYREGGSAAANGAFFLALLAGFVVAFMVD